ncbi:MAG: tetratricopeptide repeat protein, partial [Methanomicrobiales archaeon]
EPNNTDSLNYKGTAMLQVGLQDKALTVFEKVIQIDPTNVVAWTTKGYILYKQGNIDGSIKAYNTALSIDPYNADANRGRNEAIRIIWPHYR